MIEAKIVTDSISEADVRLTTMLLTYPRFIHSELMTHRMFSRNAASSRAIPFERMVETIRNNPAMPVKWGTHQKGMQSGPPLESTFYVKEVWLDALHDAIKRAQELNEYGIHKSITNRLLEPFAHMTTIVTATEWENFFALRAHPDAQPEFQELAYQMLDVYLDNKPTPRAFGEWHLPFVKPEDPPMPLAQQVRVSVARCARVSYATFKESSVIDDIALCDRLISSGHWSPFEHVATPFNHDKFTDSNFRGWNQWRKNFPNENRTTDLQLLRRGK